MTDCPSLTLTESPPALSAEPGNGRQTVLICLALVLATFVAFAPVLSAGFLNYDDPSYVTGRPEVCRGLTRAGLAWAFGHAQVGLWHPLTTVGFMAEVQCFGLNPKAFHLVNLVFHAASVVLVFLLLRQMTLSTWRSMLVAALFGIHPLRVESVAWISELKDVLSVFFILLAMLAYVAYVRRGGWWRYSIMIPLLTLSLLAKPMYITLPAVALLLDYWPLGRVIGASWRKWAWLVVEKLPLVAVCLVVLLIGRVIQNRDYPPDVAHYTEIATHPLSLRLANAPISCVRYIARMVDFTGLSLHYPMPPYWPMWQVGLSCAFLLLVTGLVLGYGRRYRHLPVGWFWFLGMLVPALGIFAQICDYAMADRYTYLASVGLLIMVVWSISDQWVNSDAARRYGKWAALGIVLILGLFTFRQCQYWKSPVKLFQRAVLITPQSSQMHQNLGGALSAVGQYDAAIEQCRAVLRLRPRSRDAYFNMGQTFASACRFDEAIASFRKALEIVPQDDGSMVSVGHIYRVHDQPIQEMSAYRIATTMNPQNITAWTGLGISLSDRKEFPEALWCFGQVIAISPRDTMAHLNAAFVLNELGRSDEALAQCHIALAIEPDMASAHYALGLSLMKLGKPSEALAELEQALQLSPADPKVQEALDQLRAQLAGKRPASAPATHPIPELSATTH